MAKWHNNGFLGAAIAAALLAGGTAVASALPTTTGFMANDSTSFSYTGTVTAPDGTSYTIPGFTSTPATPAGLTSYTGRDGEVFVTNNLPAAVASAQGAPTNAMIFGTNWFSSADGKDDGTDNPNNIDTGFVQLYDLGFSGITSITGGWTNDSYTTFELSVRGNGAGLGAAEASRLWAAPEVGGAATETAGAFGDYSLLLTATFAPGDVTEGASGWYSTTDNPTSITGSFSGTFDNTGNSSSSARGIYEFDLTFLNDSWAGANGLDPGSTYFGASSVSVPEPPVLGIFGLGVLALGGMVVFDRKRRHVAER